MTSNLPNQKFIYDPYVECASADWMDVKVCKSIAHHFPLLLKDRSPTERGRGRGGIMGGKGRMYCKLSNFPKGENKMSRMVKRHRLIYYLLNNELQSGLYALSIEAKMRAEVPTSLIFGRIIDIQQISNVGFLEHYFNFATYNELSARANVRNAILTFMGHGGEWAVVICDGVMGDGGEWAVVICDGGVLAVVLAVEDGGGGCDGWVAMVMVVAVAVGWRWHGGGYN
nr:hypothetical protein [Tanacetum cinerariifolium]